jgi:hypothetical protein
MDGRLRALVSVFPSFPHTHAARRGRTHRRASWGARQRPRLWFSPQILMRLQWHAHPPPRRAQRCLYLYRDQHLDRFRAQAGCPIHYTIVSRWPRVRWPMYTSKHSLSLARSEIDSVAPFVTGGPPPARFYHPHWSPLRWPLAHGPAGWDAGGGAWEEERRQLPYLLTGSDAAERWHHKPAKGKAHSEWGARIPVLNHRGKV